MVAFLYYTQELGWTPNETFYFYVVVVTTVGYGDNQPIEGDGPLLFTTAFVLLAAALVFSTIALVLDTFSNWREAAVKKAQNEKVAYLLHPSTTPRMSLFPTLFAPAFFRQAFAKNRNALNIHHVLDSDSASKFLDCTA